MLRTWRHHAQCVRAPHILLAATSWCWVYLCSAGSIVVGSQVLDKRSICWASAEAPTQLPLIFRFRLALLEQTLAAPSRALILHVPVPVPGVNRGNHSPDCGMEGFGPALDFGPSLDLCYGGECGRQMRCSAHINFNGELTDAVHTMHIAYTVYNSACTPLCMCTQCESTRFEGNFGKNMKMQ